jgi:predicted Fe-Mo cluster-binding NifX family protein
MILCLTASDSGLSAEIDPRFGRCRVFTFVDTETMEYHSMANPGASAAGGAGPQAAQFLADQGAEALITGQVGPNAFATLNTLAIKIYEAREGIVKELVAKFKQGSLKEILDQRIRF